VRLAVCVVVARYRDVSRQAPLGRGRVREVRAGLEDVPCAGGWPKNRYVTFAVSIVVTWNRHVADQAPLKPNGQTRTGLQNVPRSVTRTIGHEIRDTIAVEVSGKRDVGGEAECLRRDGRETTARCQDGPNVGDWPEHSRIDSAVAVVVARHRNVAGSAQCIDDRGGEAGTRELDEPLAGRRPVNS